MKGKKEFKKRRNHFVEQEDLRLKKKVKKYEEQKKGKKFSIYEEWEDETQEV